MKTTTSFRIDDSLLDVVNTYCALGRISKSALITTLLAAEISNDQPDLDEIRKRVDAGYKRLAARLPSND